MRIEVRTDEWLGEEEVVYYAHCDKHHWHGAAHLPPERSADPIIRYFAIRDLVNGVGAKCGCTDQALVDRFWPRVDAPPVAGAA